MGIEFIKMAGKTFRRRWDRERVKLSFPDLFRGERERIRTISVTPYDVSNFHEGDRYMLDVRAGRIFVIHNRLEIGVCENPPQSVVNDINELGGRTMGVYFRLREHSGLVDVAVSMIARANEEAA